MAAPNRRRALSVLVGLMLVLGGLAFTAVTGAAPAHAATPADGMAYVADAGQDAVLVFDTTTNTVVTSVPVGSFPFDLAVTPDGTRVYVTNANSNNVSVIDTATNTVVATVPVGTFPTGVAVTPDGTRVYVANNNGPTNVDDVSVIDTATNTVVATVPVGDGPYFVAITPDGTRAYVTNSNSNTVSVINTATNIVAATVAVGTNPTDVQVTPDGARVYVVTTGVMAVIDTATNTVVHTFSGSYGYIALSPDGARLYADNGGTSVDVIDTATNVVVAAITDGDAAFSALAVSPDGTRLYVGDANLGRMFVIDTATNTVVTITDVFTFFSPQAIAVIPPGAPPTTSVSGSAYSYYVNVGLFGGPANLRGFGEATPSADSSSPSVTLPAGGSVIPVTASKPLGAKATYGPAVIFGGIWPDELSSAPRSGPFNVSTESSADGTTVTSSTHVVLDADAVCPVETPDCGEQFPSNFALDGPGGFGPGPLVGDQAHSTCSASEAGVTGSATFVNGRVETKYNAETQLPLPEFVVPIPNPVPPNWAISGTIDHVGDNFTIILNEQILSPTGDSITVNAAHMYLRGPIAVGDMVLGSSTCAFTSTLANAAPVATDDSFTTTEDTPLTVTPAGSGLLSNDTDADSNASMTATAAPSAGTSSNPSFPSDPPNGTATINLDGTFTYTPDPGFVGQDTFTYVVRDPRGAYDTATVTVTVTPGNVAPVAADDTYETPEDTPVAVAAPGVLGNDTDVDANTLTAGSASDPAGGSIVLNANGSFTYTPDSNFNGTDSFTYTVSDGNGGTDTGQAAVTVSSVNDAPTAVDDTATTVEDTPVTVAAPGVLVSDTDVDGNILTAGSASDPTGGSVTLNADGSYTYTPDANFNGTDTFTYTVSDGSGGSDIGQVTITVTAADDAPVAVNDTATTAEDTAVTVAAPGVLGNDTDADGSPLSAVRVTDPAHGTVTLNGNGSFTYTPAGNYNGPDSFTYKANDGTADSNVATVNITVTAANDAPVAVDDTATTAEDTPVTVPLPGVLGNDTDQEGDTLTAGSASNPPNGSVTLNANGSYTYTPDANFNGTDTFTYTVSDGNGGSDTGVVTVTVTAAADNPLAVDDAYTAAEDTALTVAAPGVLGNDTDPDGNPLTASGATTPANGTVTLNANGSFTYTPNPNFSGTDTFSYTVNDGTARTDTGLVTITVNATNGSAFHPLTPTRILDSRPAPNQAGPFNTPWGPGMTRDVTVTGAGVPAGADAVTLNVTVTGTTAPGFLTIWPKGQPQPLASSLNWAAGQTIPNAVTVKVGAAGQVSVFNAVGNANVIFDVVGYYDSILGDGYTPVDPTRILDSRPAPQQVGPFNTPWGPGETRNVAVTGGAVPPNADAVVLNVTVTGTTAPGFLTIWPLGQPKPLASSLNWAPGQTIPNAVTVKVGTGGSISVYNEIGNANVIIDIVGSFSAGSGSLFHPVTPARILDSRPAPNQVGPFSTPWGADTTRQVQVTGNGGIPANATAALLNVTVTNTTAPSFLTIWPAGAAAPSASSLNWAPGQTIPNAVTTKLPATGAISIRNAVGSVDVIADTAGWYG